MDVVGAGESGWLVVLETLPEWPLTPIQIPAGGRFPLAEVTLDTTGLGTVGGTWALKLSDPQGGGSFFNVLNPADPNDVLEVAVTSLDSVLQVTQPTWVGPTVVRWGEQGNVVLEVEAVTGTAAPQVEESDDLASGTWRVASVGAVRQGGVWHWEMPVDTTKTARFFRMVAVDVGPGLVGGSGTRER
jgi:hypothetical protein